MAATCTKNESTTIHNMDRGRTGRLGRSITGEFIRSVAASFQTLFMIAEGADQC
jgi:hypothetical protein